MSSALRSRGRGEPDQTARGAVRVACSAQHSGIGGSDGEMIPTGAMDAVKYVRPAHSIGTVPQQQFAAATRTRLGPLWPECVVCGRQRVVAIGGVAFRKRYVSGNRCGLVAIRLDTSQSAASVVANSVTASECWSGSIRAGATCWPDATRCAYRQSVPGSATNAAATCLWCRSPTRPDGPSTTGRRRTWIPADRSPGSRAAEPSRPGRSHHAQQLAAKLPAHPSLFTLRAG